MSQKSALVVAIALTAFFMTMLGALITQVSQASDAVRAPTASSAPTVTPAQVEATPTLDTSAIKMAIAEREASYQQLLDRANKQIEEANAQMQKQAEALHKAETEAQTARVKAQQVQEAQAKAAAQPTAPARPAVPKFAVSPEQAVGIAWGATQGAKPTKGPELVEFEGKPAYEIGYATGVVYIDANTGKVLFTNVEVQANSDGPEDRKQGAGQNNAGKEDNHHEDEHHEDEHEGR
ncbi:MAG: PepSY domain-containing protein [Chloroflexi bacterium]|nr:PepSY domain-containing protein [Chloroflexota bacterium]